jgi:hypothetical protein
MVTHFIHYPLNQEITAIGGHYFFIKEVRLPYQGREILYRVACAAVDRSCCGVGGLGYALVPGYIIDWHLKHTNEGLPISQVEPIRASTERKKIESVIKQKEFVHQVNFE